MNARASVSMLLSVLVLGCPKEPSPAELKVKQGNELLQKSEFAQAAVEYEKALELDPKLELKVWEKAAFSHMKAGNTDKAAELLLKTVAMRDESTAKVETFRNVAGMYLQNNQLDEAEEYFAEAMKVDPKDVPSLTWLAEIASRRGGARSNEAMATPEFLDRALTRYDQLIALTPEVAAPYINKRIVLAKYIDHLGKQKKLVEADAETNERDKEAVADFLEQARKYDAKIAELKPLLDETTKQLGEVQKAAKR